MTESDRRAIDVIATSRHPSVEYHCTEASPWISVTYADGEYLHLYRHVGDYIIVASSEAIMPRTEASLRVEERLASIADILSATLALRDPPDEISDTLSAAMQHVEQARGLLLTIPLPEDYTCES